MGCIMGHCRDNSEVSCSNLCSFLPQPPTSSAAPGLEHTLALIHIIHHIPLLTEETKRGSAMVQASPQHRRTARLYSAR